MASCTATSSLRATLSIPVLGVIIYSLLVSQTLHPSGEHALLLAEYAISLTGGTDESLRNRIGVMNTIHNQKVIEYLLDEMHLQKPHFVL